jgi:hypothetical protein
VVRVLPDPPPVGNVSILWMNLRTHKDLKRLGIEAGVVFFDNSGRSERLDEDPGVS